MKGGYMGRNKIWKLKAFEDLIGKMGGPQNENGFWFLFFSLKKELQYLTSIYVTKNFFRGILKIISLFLSLLKGTS